LGSLAVQLARRTGAFVIGLASEPNHEWLKDHEVFPVTYGDGVAGRIRAAARRPPDAFIDTVGTGYVELALELGVEPDRIDTIADFAAGRTYGVKMEGNAAGADADVLSILVQLIAADELEVPIAHVFPLDQVQDAFRELKRGHTRGKIVLVP
jgi:NADPH:quinone reductase-like Zn-dependent oxidoreductase